MTFEELKSEADKLGYRLVKKSPPNVKMLPCTCGRKVHEHWYTFDGLEFYKCKQCEKEGPAGISDRDAKQKWNEMIIKEKEKLNENISRS